MTQFDRAPVQSGADVTIGANQSSESSAPEEQENVWMKQLFEIQQQRPATEYFLTKGVEVAKTYDTNNDLYLDFSEIAKGLNNPNLSLEDEAVLGSMAYARDDLKGQSDDEVFFESTVNIKDLERFIADVGAPSEIGDPYSDKVQSDSDKKILETINQFDLLSHEQTMKKFVQDNGVPLATEVLMDAIDGRSQLEADSKSAAKELGAALVSGDLQGFEQLAKQLRDDPSYESVIEGLNLALYGMDGNVRFGTLEDGSLVLFQHDELTRFELMGGYALYNLPQQWPQRNPLPYPGLPHYYRPDNRRYSQYAQSNDSILDRMQPTTDDMLAIVFGSDGKVRLRPARIQDSTYKTIIMPGEVVDADPEKMFDKFATDFRRDANSRFEQQAARTGDWARYYFAAKDEVRDELVKNGLQSGPFSDYSVLRIR